MSRRSIPLSATLFLLLASLALSGCAGALVGVGTAAVAASTTEKGLSTSVSDTQILAKIKDRFIQSNFSLVTGIDVSVNDGSVLMTGKVKTPDDKVQATRIAWEIRGVREVVNETQVIDKSSLKDIAKDVAASATLRAKLIGDGDISSLNYNINVVNGVIYLSGIAKNKAEMNKVIGHAQEVRFTQRVVNYIKIQTDKRY